MKSFKIFILFLLILFINSWTFVQAEEKSFLWQVQSSQTKVYLLGSIHVGNSELYPLKDSIEKAFDESSVLVVEVNLERWPQEYLRKETMKRGMFTNGDRLVNYLSAETLHLLNSWLEEYHLSLKQFINYKPWLVADVLETLQVESLGFDSRYGIDHYFMHKAEHKKETL